MISIEWAGQTDPGTVRANNEDAFSVGSFSAEGALTREAGAGASADLPKGGAIFTVSDGVGGGQAGEVASAIAIQSVPENIAGDDLPACFTSWDRGRRMENALRRANGQIRQESSDPAKSGMCATVTSLWILPDRAVFGQSGDSRLYRYRGGELRQLSHDQSEVAVQVRLGQITEAEARVAPNRNVIEQALGIQEQAFAPEIDWVEWISGDLFLVCSDGLVDGLDDTQLGDALRAALAQHSSLPEVTRALIAKGNAASGKDNVTVILVRVLEAASAVAAAPKVAEPARTSHHLRSTVLGGLLGALIAWGAGWWFQHRPVVDALRDREAELQQIIQDEREMSGDARKRQRVQAAALQQQVDELLGREQTLNTRLTDEAERFRALETKLAQTQAAALASESRLRADYEAQLTALRGKVADLELRLSPPLLVPSDPIAEAPAEVAPTMVVPNPGLDSGQIAPSGDQPP